MKHKVKHLHFIANHARKGFRPCSGRPHLHAQMSAISDSVTNEA
jgi:hypothetical protein